jgi:uncharacterized protein Usg
MEHILCRFLIWYGLSVSDNNYRIDIHVHVLQQFVVVLRYAQNPMDIAMDEKGHLKTWRQSMHIPGLACGEPQN